jgi:hypothetical protein
MIFDGLGRFLVVRIRKIEILEKNKLFPSAILKMENLSHFRDFFDLFQSLQGKTCMILIIEYFPMVLTYL